MSPGTSLREGLDNILRAKTGGLIVLANDKDISEIVDGGFKINADYSPAYLYELAKMDGAIVLSNLLKSNFEGMIDSSKIFVVENCIDDEYLISDKDFREKLQNIKCKDI